MAGISTNIGGVRITPRRAKKVYKAVKTGHVPHGTGQYVVRQVKKNYKNPVASRGQQ